MVKLSYENFLGTDELLNVITTYSCLESLRLTKIDNTFDEDIRKLTDFIINELYWRSDSIRLETYKTYGKLFFIEKFHHIYLLVFEIDKGSYYPKALNRLRYLKDTVIFNQSVRAKELSILDSADIINKITESMENYENWFEHIIEGSHFKLL